MALGFQTETKSLVGNTLDGFLAPFTCAWRNWDLLRSLVRRDIEARFRGSLFGMFWAGAAPLVRLATYAVVFGFMIRPQWHGQLRDPMVIAFVYFSGLVVFEFFMSCIAEAPMLIIGNKSFVKKVVFPIEILPWVVVGHGVFRLLIGFSLVIVAHFLLRGLPTLDIFLIPLFIAPLALMILGLVWVISALATYVRDVGHFVLAFLPVLMFISPVFFPLSALPATAQKVMLINPTAFPLEQVRHALFGVRFEDWPGLGIYYAAAFTVAWLGYRIFMYLRPGFADVI